MGLDNPIHILMILGVAFMLFGAKRLPELGKGLGEGMHGFSRAVRGEQPAQSLTTATAEPQAEPAHTA